MNTEPPPLPQESRKRILPAFLLCFVACLHRIYVGKYVSGLIQIGCVVGSFLWADYAMRDLMAIVNANPSDVMGMVEKVQDWEMTHGIPWMPMLAFLAVGIWVIIDARLLIGGKFTDGKGLRITRWW